MAISDAIAAIRVADVVIDSRSGGSQAIYTYKATDDLRRGDAVFVPLGARSVLGFVTGAREVSAESLGFDAASLRKPHARVHGLALPGPLVDLLEMISREYLCPLPVVLSAAIPPVRDRLTTVWSLVKDPDRESLTTLQREVIIAIEDAGGTLVEHRSKKGASGADKALRLLRSKGIVEQQLRLSPAQDERQAPPLLRLASDPDRIEAFLRNEGRKKPAQALTIIRLQEADDARLTASEIKGLSGVTDTTVKALLSAGLLEPVSSDSPALKEPPAPNKYQQVAIDSVVEAVQEQRPLTFLLYGVTGSGKTEVYLRAASEALRLGRQVLYLVPEIALATQVIAQLRERFGRSVAILHSDLKPSERIETWIRIRSGEAPLVLGARSALFSPLDNLGLIVMDEEHEAAYKQESSPRYHSKALAGFLSEVHGCPLLLGSATPSVESFCEAENGRLELLSLPTRVASAQLPTVHLEDLSSGYKSGRPSILSDQLSTRIDETLARGEQAILFLNRRAYAPFLICRDCGHQFKCPHCAVSLSYSRRDRRMRCHHCGYGEAPPETCPSCHGIRLNPFGVGTEKVEEAVRESFPDAAVARLDRDVTQRKGALEQVLAGFRSGETQILVGTQMVAKGLDFPNVTLVGVIAADISLNIPDFRASERTFQLLSQVGGRAGRGKAAGHVVIQTFNPEHVAIQAARDHAFLPFFEEMKQERSEAGYPPFKRLVNIVCTGEDRSAVIACARQVADSIAGLESVEVLGPADCAIERLQGRWRRHVLLKFPPGASVQEVADGIKLVDTRGVQIVIDVDPYSLI